MADKPFTRASLRGRGFVGFERFRDLDLNRVPEDQGVYVLLRETEDAPVFLERSPAGWFKNNDPTEDIEVLRDRWIEGAHCVYIGKADRSLHSSLRRRLRDFRDFGVGAPIGHRGGRYVWQLGDAADYVLAWQLTDEEPIKVEDELIADFEAIYGRLPFANIHRPRRRQI